MVGSGNQGDSRRQTTRELSGLADVYIDSTAEKSASGHGLDERTAGRARFDLWILGNTCSAPVRMGNLTTDPAVSHLAPSSHLGLAHPRLYRREEQGRTASERGTSDVPAGAGQRVTCAGQRQLEVEPPIGRGSRGCSPHSPLPDRSRGIPMPRRGPDRVKSFNRGVAKLADANDSKSFDLTVISVRPRAPGPPTNDES